MPGPESYQTPIETQEEIKINESKDNNFDVEEYGNKQKEQRWKIQDAEQKDKQIDSCHDKIDSIWTDTNKIQEIVINNLIEEIYDKWKIDLLKNSLIVDDLKNSLKLNWFQKPV